MNKLTDTLKTLIATHGIEILQQEQRLKAMLADLLPHEKRMRYLLELSLRADIPNKITALQNEEQAVWETQISSLKHYFKEEYFLEEKAVEAVFDSWEEVICIKEETVTDIDGNVYHTIKIGSQTWMVENLKTTRYNDGTVIPNITDNNVWSFLQTGTYCCYDNEPKNKDKYGALYNWFAVDTKKLAPKGWHVPTDEEWTELENYLIANGYNYDGTTERNKIAKSLVAKTGWKTSLNVGTFGNNLSANNKSGFSGLPAGYRDYCGNYGYVGSDGYWWSSTEVHDTYAWYRGLHYCCHNLYSRYEKKRYGFSVRCVKD